MSLERAPTRGEMVGGGGVIAHPPGGEAGHPFGMERIFGRAGAGEVAEPARLGIVAVQIIDPGDALLEGGQRLGRKLLGPGAEQGLGLDRLVVADQRLEQGLELVGDRVAADVARPGAARLAAEADQALLLGQAPAALRRRGARARRTSASACGSSALRCEQGR